MKKSKQQKLNAAGWKIGSVEDFLYGGFMEKTGDYEITITKQSGILMMRLPNGSNVPYDGRFKDETKIHALTEGASISIPKED